MILLISMTHCELHPHHGPLPVEMSCAPITFSLHCYLWTLRCCVGLVSLDKHSQRPLGPLEATTLLDFAMHSTRLLLLLAGFAAAPAFAYDWAHVAPFSRPANIYNRCTDPQRHGFDFKNVEDGPIGIYGDMLFSDFTVLRPTTRQDEPEPEPHEGHIFGMLQQSPSISAVGARPFSIHKLQLRSSCDAQIELQYHTPDGLTCTNTHMCTTSPLMLRNTQCGGESHCTSNYTLRCAILFYLAEIVLPRKSLTRLSERYRSEQGDLSSNPRDPA